MGATGPMCKILEINILKLANIQSRVSLVIRKWHLLHNSQVKGLIYHSCLVEAKDNQERCNITKPCCGFASYKYLRKGDRGMTFNLAIMYYDAIL